MVRTKQHNKLSDDATKENCYAMISICYRKSIITPTYLWRPPQFISISLNKLGFFSFIGSERFNVSGWDIPAARSYLHQKAPMAHTGLLCAYRRRVSHLFNIYIYRPLKKNRNSIHRLYQGLEWIVQRIKKKWHH